MTKDAILLAHPNSTKLVDAIPLFELEEATFMQDISKEGGSKSEDISKREIVDPSAHHGDGKEKKTGKTNLIKFHHSFQLRTSPDGYNSGRQYIIQAHSEEQCQSLVEQVRRLSKIATEIYLAKSRFLKAQVRTLAQKPVLTTILPRRDAIEIISRHSFSKTLTPRRIPKFGAPDKTDLQPICKRPVP